MRLLAGLVSLSLVVVACSGQEVSMEGFRELKEELAQAESELVDVTAERDALLAQQELDSARVAKSQITADAIGQIVSDPASFGTEEQVVELLSHYITPDAITHDLAYGKVGTIQGWRNTLFAGDIDAVTFEWHNWMSDDGSQGGSLWTWQGANFVGEPFELIGVALTTYNDDGLETSETVIWPYPDEYVYEQFGVGP